MCTIVSRIAAVSSAREIPPISHKPIPVPIWATLPMDSGLARRPLPIRLSPGKIALDEYSRCCCGAPAVAGMPTSWGPCKVYTSLEAFICQIETQVCPNGCSGGGYRFVGPDCSEIGLFNYNNRILFAHDLLNDYTLCYTTSETPFTAWVTITRTRYLQFAPEATFVTEEVFRGAWFSFALLQSFGGEMQCPLCGPEPSAVIFDGVSISFGKKHLTDTLKPPTLPDDYSPVRSCRPVPGQAALTDKSLRSNIRKVINGRSLFISPEELGQRVGSIDSGSDVEEGSPASGVTDKVVKEVVERIDLIPKASQGLSATNTFLGNLFHRYCGTQRLAEKCPSPRPMIHLFREVSIFYNSETLK
jgi:hypothetical protein